jgi:hypothetical protein
LKSCYAYKTTIKAVIVAQSDDSLHALQGIYLMNELTTLSTLAVEINMLNEQVEHHKNQAVIYAARTGAKLNEVKESLGNDKAKFVEWLEANCNVKVAHAYNFIRLSKQMPQLLDSSVQTSVLGLNQAIELLSAPEEVKTEVTAKIEAGEDVTIKEIQRLKKEAADLQASKEALQVDLITTQQQLTEKEKLFDWLKIDQKAIYEQNDKLRDDIAFKVAEIAEERIASESARLILENQQAIADAKRDAENAKHEFERLKREQEKAIADGVAHEINRIQADIDQKCQELEQLERDITAVEQTKFELNAKVNLLTIHNIEIMAIKDCLSSLRTHFLSAFDTSTIPAEVLGEWQSIRNTVKNLDAQMDSFFDSHSVIDGAVVEM